MNHEVARTILSQLGGNKFIAMTGAKGLVASENSLSFRIGSNSTHCNAVHVEYDYGKDLYNLSFVRCSKRGRTVLKKYDAIYAEDMVRLFEDYTGLRTKLF